MLNTLRGSARRLFLTVLALIPAAAFGQGADAVRYYEDPAGEFKVEIPKGWQVERSENAVPGMKTVLNAPDETANLTFFVMRVPPYTNMDDNLVDVTRQFFDGWRALMEDKGTIDYVKVGALKREQLWNRLCLRQDYSYRRKSSATLREASAIAFFNYDSLLFVTLSGTADKAKVARDAFKTFVFGTAGVEPVGTAKETQKLIVELESLRANSPRNLPCLTELHLAYFRMLYHYTNGELKSSEKAQEHAKDYLEKSRQVGILILKEMAPGQIKPAAEVQRLIADLEPRVANSPRNLPLLIDLNLAYINMMYHYIDSSFQVFLY
jgi:hypothetical protein